MDIIYESKKRKFDAINDNENDNDNEYFVEPKKIKLFKNENKMIYALDTEVHFTEQINKTTIETLIKKITKIINKYHDKYEGTNDKLNITYIVDSPGGCLSSTFKFIDFISLTKKKYPYINFTSVITGCCASACTLISIPTDKRQMTRLASVMIHQLKSGRESKFAEFMSYSKHLNNQHEKLVKIYLDNSNVTREQLENLLINETWMTPEEYKCYGFIDEIIG